MINDRKRHQHTTRPNQNKIRRTAAQIATELGETKKQPQHQIKLIVQECGVTQAQAWLQETQEIEQQGGMLTSDGQERRTAGGIYFKLVRSHLIQEGELEKMRAIFRGKKGVRQTSLNAGLTGTRQQKPRRPKPRRW